MSAPVPPCKDCTKRHEACHSDCEPYQAFSKERLAYNLQIAEVKGHNVYFQEKAKQSYYGKVKKKQQGKK